MPRASRLAVPAWLLIVATMQSPASADEVDDWVEHGVQLRRARNDAQALEYFRRAYEARPTPRTRVQMALAEQALGRWIEAETDLAEALKMQGEPWIDRNREKLSEGLETIRDHLGSLRVESQEGAELRVNGTRVGELPIEGFRVVAGTLQIELRANDFEPWGQSVEVKPRETVRVVAQLASASSVPPPSLPMKTEPVRVAPAPLPRTLAWVTLGAGGLLLLQATVAQVIRGRAIEIYNDDSQCLRPGLSREQVCGNYRGRAETAQTWATVGWVGGGLATGAGLILLLAAPSAPTRSVSVTVTPDGYGVGWRGAF